MKGMKLVYNILVFAAVALVLFAFATVDSEGPLTLAVIAPIPVIALVARFVRKRIEYAEYIAYKKRRRQYDRIMGHAA